MAQSFEDINGNVIKIVPNKTSLYIDPNNIGKHNSCYYVIVDNKKYNVEDNVYNTLKRHLGI